MPLIVDNKGPPRVVVVERARSVLARPANPVNTVTENTRAVEVAARGARGPKGDPSADGTNTLQKIAAAALGGHRIVRMVSATGVDYASNDVETHADDTLGLTEGAAGVGETVFVAANKDIVEPSWSWVDGGELFLGRYGLMTQEPPSLEAGDAFSLPVGVATSPTSARIRIGVPIFL